MFIINKYNKIYLTKGDNAEMSVRVFNKNGKEIEIKENDEVLMTVKKNTSDTNPAFTLTAYRNTFYILPEHTNNLSAGLYVYDIQYTNDLGEISTIIPTSYFEIMEEVSKCAQ